MLADRRPDIVLSGFNHGANLGEDVGYSGTVAAAMEAALLGIKAVALSQVRSGERAIDFATSEQLAPPLLRRLYAMDWHRDLLINVNFPPLPAEQVTGVRVGRQGRRDEAVGIIEGRDPGGRPYLWIGDFASNTTREDGTDLAAIAEGAIAVTPLHLDLTHAPTLSLLDEVLR